MNSRKLTIAVLLLFVLSAPTLALAWPTNAQFLPIYKGGVYLTDPDNDSVGARNIVGDATYPAAYMFNDGTYLYMRMRVDGDPTGTGGQGLLKAFGWGVLFDTNLNANDYEWLFMCDGISSPEVVALRQNTVQGNIGDPSDSAEVDSSTVPLAGNYQITVAGSNFSGNADYFVDWRFDYATLKAVTGLGDYDPLKVLFGTSTSTQSITESGADLAPGTGVTLYNGLSDPITMLATRPTTATVRFVSNLAGTGDETSVEVGSAVFVRVDEGDTNTDTLSAQTLTVTLTATGGDSQILTLTETGPNTGVFTGTINTLNSATHTAGNGVLEVLPGETVTASFLDYIDATLARDQTRTDTIRVIGVSLTITKTASAATAIRGDEITYTIRLENAGEVAALVTQLADTPPTGFSYVAGSTTGATTAEPVASGGTLTWNGSWTVPAAVSGTPGVLTLSFKLLVASPGGTYTDDASVSGSNFTALSTGPTAPVTVLAPSVTLAKSVDKGAAAPGEEITYAIVFRNVGSAPAHTLLVLDTLPPETEYVAGSLRAGDADDTYDTAVPRTDGPGEADANPVQGEVSGTTVIFNIPSLAADDGAPGTGPDEGAVWFKARVR